MGINNKELGQYIENEKEIEIEIEKLIEECTKKLTREQQARHKKIVEAFKQAENLSREKQVKFMPQRLVLSSPPTYTGVCATVSYSSQGDSERMNLKELARSLGSSMPPEQPQIADASHLRTEAIKPKKS